MLGNGPSNGLLVSVTAYIHKSIVKVLFAIEIRGSREKLVIENTWQKIQHHKPNNKLACQAAVKV